MTTLDEAKELIERMKARMLPCSPCLRTVVAYNSDFRPIESEGWVSEGHSPTHAGVVYVQHAPNCDGGKVPAYPWASKLDAERVREYMEAQTSVFLLSDLEALV